MSGGRTHAVISLADLKPAALDHSAIIAYFYLMYNSYLYLSCYFIIYIILFLFYFYFIFILFLFYFKQLEKMDP